MSRRHTVAVSGCGAVTESYYVPALRRLERAGRLGVTSFYDPDDASCARVARSFARAHRAESFDAMLEVKPELVIVASPPSLHAAQSTAALVAGAAVFCEKPVALTSREAVALEHAAHAAARLLAVGMVRRRFPAARLVKQLLERGALGRPIAFECFEGGPFRWPLRSPGYFERAHSGGGVLADLGPHLLDLLAYWLGALELRSAADDAMGGVEANARLELACGEVFGRVRLSRDWQRPNELVLRCERGAIRWALDDIAAVEIEHADGRRERLADETGVTFDDCFAAQLEAVLDRLAGARAEVVEVSELVPIVAVIERAYATRTTMAMPWLAPVVRRTS